MSHVTITVDGRTLRVARDASVAAVLLDNNVQAFRRSVSGADRAPLCGMGICYECRVTIDDVAHRRACLVTVADGQRITTTSGAGS